MNCSFKSDVFRLYSAHARIPQTVHKRIYQSYKLSHALKLLWINASPSAFLYLMQTYENTICRCMCLADCHLTFSCAEIDGRNRRPQRDTGSKEKKKSEHETLRMLHRNVVKRWNTDYAISHTYFAKLWSALWSEMQIIQEQVILVLDKIKAGLRWPCRLLFYNVSHTLPRAINFIFFSPSPYSCSLAKYTSVSFLWFCM